MEKLLAIAHRIAVVLKARGESIAVTESSAGGLVSAALLAVPGASAYYVGGGVIYTAQAREQLLGISLDAMHAKGLRSSSEPYAAWCAQTIAARLGTTWGLAETGASGPTGNRYGDPAGHTCFAVAGLVAKTGSLKTGSDDREQNMWAFAEATLDFYAKIIEAVD